MVATADATPVDPWTNLLLWILYTAIGVGYLAKGGSATLGYLWIGLGALTICLSIAAFARRRRHPLPPKGRWYDNLYR